MKTAMQELIRIMEETMSDQRCDIIIARSIKAHIKLATELLAKEKEQIVDAYNGAGKDWSKVLKHEKEIYGNGETYFNQTYKQ